MTKEDRACCLEKWGELARWLRVFVIVPKQSPRSRNRGIEQRNRGKWRWRRLQQQPYSIAYLLASERCELRGQSRSAKPTGTSTGAWFKPHPDTETQQWPVKPVESKKTSVVFLYLQRCGVHTPTWNYNAKCPAVNSRPRQSGPLSCRASSGA